MTQAPITARVRRVCLRCGNGGKKEAVVASDFKAMLTCKCGRSWVARVRRCEVRPKAAA